MGFMSMLNPQRKKKDLGVCIPDVRKRMERERQKPVEYVDSLSRFRVQGIYSVGTELTLMGEVISGSIKPKNEASFKGKALAIGEIHCGSRSCEVLKTGEKGTLSILAGAHPPIKAGDVLEFE